MQSQEGWWFHLQHHLVGSKQHLADTRHTATPTKNYSSSVVLQATETQRAPTAAWHWTLPTYRDTLLPLNPLWPCPCQLFSSSGFKLISGNKYFKELVILNSLTLVSIFSTENKVTDNQGRKFFITFKKSMVLQQRTWQMLLSKLFWDLCSGSSFIAILLVD